VSRPETLAMIGARLAASGAPAHTRVWAMIETAFAVLRVEAIAAMALVPEARLSCFVIGANDLAKDTRARIVPGRAPMLPWLAMTLAAARAYQLDILDGVYNDFSDLDAFRAEAEQGRDMGFDGKTLSHPSQAEIANAVFSPTAEELKKAHEIIDAFALPENRDKGAISLNGWMVERLHAEMAGARRRAGRRNPDADLSSAGLRSQRASDLLDAFGRLADRIGRQPLDLAGAGLGKARVALEGLERAFKRLDPAAHLRNLVGESQGCHDMQPHVTQFAQTLAHVVDARIIQGRQTFEMCLLAVAAGHAVDFSGDGDRNLPHAQRSPFRLMGESARCAGLDSCSSET
jgi:hypothetical protein